MFIVVGVELKMTLECLDLEKNTEIKDDRRKEFGGSFDVGVGDFYFKCDAFINLICFCIIY